MCVIILFITLAACKDTDNRVFGDDFDFPALTDENTIRFTVNVVGYSGLNVISMRALS